MATDLAQLTKWLEWHSLPALPCPACKIGDLAAEEYTTVESQASAKMHDHPAWEPDWISGQFMGTLRCSRGGCSEPVVVAGDYSVDWTSYEEENGEFYSGPGDHIKIRYTHPPIPIMTYPEAVPEEVKDRITQAERVIWMDPGAAANRLQLAIEQLLTAQGVRKTMTSKGQRTRLTTHARILEFKKQNAKVGDTLEAVKWIGNQGSHDDVTVEEVLAGAAILEYALRLLYDKTDSDIAKLVKKINAAKRVPRKRPTKRP